VLSISCDNLVSLSEPGKGSYQERRPGQRTNALSRSLQDVLPCSNREISLSSSLTNAHPFPQQRDRSSPALLIYTRNNPGKEVVIDHPHTSHRPPRSKLMGSNADPAVLGDLHPGI
jgi:hypothetical protein